jgi:MoxR-like ATPase
MKKQIVTLSPTLRRLLLELETHCRADCCKAAAFGLSVESILRWLEGERVDRTAALLDEINKIHTAVQIAQLEVFIDSRDLYSSWKFVDFDLFWQDFATNVERAIEAR